VRWLVLGDFNQIRRARDKNKAERACAPMCGFSN
jgi:hypothetical protein